MVKKSLNTKVLKELSNGFTIKIIRKFKDVKLGKMMTRVMESSNIGLFKGKKLIQGNFTKIEDAINYYNNPESQDEK